MTLYQLWQEGTRLLEQAGVADGAQDARTLLLEAFQMDMTHFLLERMRELPGTESSAAAVAQYRRWIEMRSGRTPLQHLLKTQEFMGLPFAVNEHVLIPRQDTETLVELVLAEQKDPRIRLLDVCTGSGCIPISLAVKGGYEDMTAADISEKALDVARENWAALRPKTHSQGEKNQKNGPREGGAQAANSQGEAGRAPQKLTFFQGDLFAALPPGTQPFDVITSNPPYIPTEVIRGLEPEVRDHEPILALDGAEDGLHFYRRLAKEAGQWLTEGGSLYLEIGHDQGEAVSGLLREAGFEQIQVVKDLPGHDRVVRGTWKNNRINNSSK